MSRLTRFTAAAVVPEQLLPYVDAVSGSRSLLCEGFAAHVREGSLVLVAYPLATDPDFASLASACAEAAGSGRPAPSIPADFAARVNAAVNAAAALPGISKITVLAPLRPSSAPASASSREDMWWELPLPFRNDKGEAPGQKLRNMLRRASRELETCSDVWSGEHAALVRGYLRSRALAPGTRHIFGRLETYAATPGAVLFSARGREDGVLRAFAMGDLAAFTTAFYMFAFRDPGCPPGGSDLALAALADAAAGHGHASLNLGLGISSGIVFFKRKWNARPLFPYLETSWNTGGTERSGGFWRRLFGRRA